MESTKKYELVKENAKECCGCTLFQIRALKDFRNIKKGDLGGWVEKEGNLSQEGNAWVSGNAWVYGNACVCGNACVFDNAKVSDNACVYGDAWVYGNAKVYGDAWVSDNAWVSGNAQVYGNAVATTKVLNFNYLDYNLTLTDNHIRIGCKQFTYEIAIKLSEKDCGKLFTTQEFKEMWKYKTLILELIKVKRPDLFKKAKQGV